MTPYRPSKTERLLAIYRGEQTDIYDSAAGYLIKQRFAVLVLTDRGRAHADKVLRERGAHMESKRDENVSSLREDLGAKII